MSNKSDLELAIEKATGESVDSLRNTTIAERRKEIERSRGRPLKVVSFWPWIGRGNIMHGKTKSRLQVDSEVDEALR